MSTDAWSTVHVYLHNERGTVDRFLTEQVVPGARALAGEAGDWHFLRYWWGGPHLRVRMRGVDAEAFEVWTAELGRAVPDAELALDEAAFARAFTDASPVAWRPHGTLDLHVPYEPEIARYGGPAAMPHAERTFSASSELAADLLATGPTPAELRVAATDVVLVALEVLGRDGLAGAASARSYFSSWDYIGETRSDGAAARRAAEAAFHGDRERWIRRRDAVRAAQGGIHGRVRRLLTAQVEALRAIEAAGTALDAPVEAVVWSQVHMLANRLGIPVDDERVAAWLASLVIPAAGADADYFADGPAAADRAYVEASGYRFAEMGGAQEPKRIPARAVPPRRARTRIPLPDAVAPPGGLAAALDARRSGYGAYGPIGRTELAALFAGAFGPVGTDPTGTDQAGTVGRRRHPSPSQAYATEVFVVVRDVDGLEPGSYRYDVLEHALDRWAGPIADDDLARWTPFVSERPGPASVDLATLPALVVLASDLGVLRPKYGLRALRLALVETGHMSQNLALVAAALGLASVPIAGYDDAAVNQHLALDGIDRIATAVLPIGAALGSGT